MARRPGPQVQIYDIRIRPDKRRPYIVQWRVGTGRPTRAFHTKREADDFRNELISAKKNGLPFSTDTSLPIEWETREITVAELAYQWFHSRYDDWAPRTRRSASEPTIELLLALLSPKAPTALKRVDHPDRAKLREEIADWLSSTDAMDSMPALLRKHSLPLERLSKRSCREAETAVMARQSGGQKKPATQQRYRSSINALFNWAVENDYLPANPWPKSKRNTKKTRAAKGSQGVLDASRLGQPTVDDVVQMLDSIAGPNSRLGAKSRRMVFELVFYAGLRPSEAVALRLENCHLPEKGWGQATVERALTSSTRRWTQPDEMVGETKTAPRIVPLPPPLIVRIRAFVGDRTTGLVAPNERGGMHDLSRLSASWRKHRLSESWRPYDLRASITSLHINAGALIAEVAAFMGNSPEVIFKHYLGSTAQDLGRSYREVEERLIASHRTPQDNTQQGPEETNQ